MVWLHKQNSAKAVTFLEKKEAIRKTSASENSQSEKQKYWAHINMHFKTENKVFLQQKCEWILAILMTVVTSKLSSLEAQTMFQRRIRQDTGKENQLLFIHTRKN